MLTSSCDADVTGNGPVIGVWGRVLGPMIGWKRD